MTACRWACNSMKRHPAVVCFIKVGMSITLWFNGGDNAVSSCRKKCGPQALWGHPSHACQCVYTELSTGILCASDMASHCAGSPIATVKRLCAVPIATQLRPASCKGLNPRASKKTEVRQQQVEGRACSNQTSAYYAESADGHHGMQATDRRTVAASFLTIPLLLVAIGVHSSSAVPCLSVQGELLLEIPDY